MKPYIIAIVLLSLLANLALAEKNYTDFVKSLQEKIKQ